MRTEIWFCRNFPWCASSNQPLGRLAPPANRIAAPDAIRLSSVTDGSVQKLVGCGGHRYDRSGDVDLGVVNALGIAIDRDGYAQRGSWRRRNGDQPA